MSQITPTQNMLLSSISDDNIRYRIEQFIQDHNLDTDAIEDLCRFANDAANKISEAYNSGYDDACNESDDNADDWD